MRKKRSASGRSSAFCRRRSRSPARAFRVCAESTASQLWRCTAGRTATAAWGGRRFAARMRHAAKSRGYVRTALGMHQPASCRFILKGHFRIHERCRPESGLRPSLLIGKEVVVQLIENDKYIFV